MPKTELLTLALVQQNNRLLLGHKKYGFGKGRWNGFGGHVETGESIEAAARRELWEEAGLTAVELISHGRLEFTFASNLPNLDVHVFAVPSFTGEPIETAEMRPQWFPLDAIPYADMWADDRHWLPVFLAGHHFHGRFHFQDDKVLVQHEVKIVSPAGFEPAASAFGGQRSIH